MAEALQAHHFQHTKHIHLPFQDHTSQDQCLQDHINVPFQDPLKTAPLTCSLKTNIPEPIINVARDISSMMAAFFKSFDMIGNMPGFYTIRTEPSINLYRMSKERSQ